MIPKNEKKKLYSKKATTEKIRYYYAIRRVPRVGDYWPAFQVEVVGVEGDKIVKKELVGKPDTLTMVMAILTDLTDPTNAPETEDATNTFHP